MLVFLTVALGLLAVFSNANAADDGGFLRAFQIVQQIEGRGNYDAWNSNDNGYGISFGIIQFNQRAGSLLELFRRMHRADSDLWYSIFGREEGDLLISNGMRRLNLNQPKYKNGIMKTAQYAKYRAVQDALTKEWYWDVALAELESVGKNLSFEWRALMFSAVVQFGQSTYRDMLKDATSPDDFVGYVRLIKPAFHKRYVRVLREARG